MATLETIFKSFDIDGNGYIQLKELKQVASKLGDNLTDEQLDELIQGIDGNNDSKISFEEFKQWWLKGHIGKLNKLVFLKAKSLKMYNFIENQFNQSGISLEVTINHKPQNYKPTTKTNKHTIKIQYGQQSHCSTSVHFQYLQQGVKSSQKFENQAKTNPFLSLQTPSLVLNFPTKQPSVLKDKLQELALGIMESLTGSPISLEDLNKSEYLNLKFQAQENNVLVHVEAGDMIGQLLEQITRPQEKLVQKLGKQFFAELDVKLRLNFTIEELINSSKPLIETIMKGFAFTITTQMTQSAFKYVKSFASLQQRIKQFAPAFLLKNSKLKLKLKTPQKLHQFFQKLGVDDIVSSTPNLGELLDQFSPQIRKMKTSSDSENKDDLVPFFNLIYAAFEIVANYVQTGTQICIVNKGTIISLKFQGNAIENIFRRIFNIE